MTTMTMIRELSTSLPTSVEEGRYNGDVRNDSQLARSRRS